MQTVLTFLFGYLTAALSFCAIATAQEIPPGDIVIKTEHYEPSYSYLGEGNYYYDISWQGINVADGKISIEEQLIDDSPKVQVYAQAWTSGAISALYKLKHHSAATFDGISFLPDTFFSVQTENKKTKYEQIYFHPDGLIESDKWKDERKMSDRVSFFSNNLTFDPITAIFYARSLPMEIGAERTFDVFTGKHRYLITLKVDRLETIKIAGRDIEAYRVVPRVDKLTDMKPDKKFRGASIWISADENRHILKMESEVWIGSIVAEMKKFEPRRSPQSFTVRAQPLWRNPIFNPDAEN